MDSNTEVMLGVVKGGTCYGFYMAQHESCSVCGIAKFCEPATKTQAQRVVHPPTPPPQPKPVEDAPPISPFDYFIQSLKGKHDVFITPGDKLDTYDVKSDGEPIMRIYHAKGNDGRMKVMRPLHEPKTIMPIKSIEDAERLLKDLL